MLHGATQMNDSSAAIQWCDPPCLYIVCSELLVRRRGQWGAGVSGGQGAAVKLKLNRGSAGVTGRLPSRACRMCPTLCGVPIRYDSVPGPRSFSYPSLERV